MNLINTFLGIHSIHLNLYKHIYDYNIPELIRYCRYLDIYCIVCHSQVGNGKGIITQYDYPVIPANLHDERIRTQPDGEMYNTIRYGLRSMPAYGYQIEADDVWSIVHYVRALQRSQNATFEDLPKDEQEKIAKES